MNITKRIHITAMLRRLYSGAELTFVALNNGQHMKIDPETADIQVIDEHDEILVIDNRSNVISCIPLDHITAYTYVHPPTRPKSDDEQATTTEDT